MTPSEAKQKALAEVAGCGVRTGQLWKHYKGGHYAVQSVGLLETTLDAVVTYVDKDGVVWTRALSAWLQVLESGDPRFTLACCDPTRCQDHVAQLAPLLMTARWDARQGRYL